ncbi:MAG: ABC transporter ATP-binding protein [Coprobacillus sp.]
MSNILIEANNISRVYDPDIFLKRGKNFYALDNVNFILEEGDFTCIMGPSGSGKSTLLNCLSTLDRVTSGNVLLEGVDMTTLNKNELCEFRYKTLGFIFQDHNLISYLTIFDNIATPAILGKQNSKDLHERVIQLSKDLEIEDLLDKYPHECSGGECQRVAIARALINNPKVIFCDEPTGNLDSKNSHKVLSILSKLNKQGTAILLVTHDPMIASYSKTLMYLYDGGIKTVIHKNDGSQTEFFKTISEVTMEDSLLNEFSPKQ